VKATHSTNGARLALIACTLAIVLAGCGAHAVQTPPGAPGALDVRPSSTLTPSDLAYGGGRWLAGPAAPRRTPDLDGFLKPDAVAGGKAPARTPPKQQAPARKPALPPRMVFTPEEVAVAESAQSTGIVPAAFTYTAPVADRSDLQQYAQREQRSRQLQGYQGGDAIVISASTLVIVLLVVLLLVLLT
jgi:hypothetical protein